MPQSTTASQPTSIFNSAQKRKKKNPSKIPSGDSTGPASAEGGQQGLDLAPDSRCNFQQVHEVPLQCRALLPRSSYPGRGLPSGLCLVLLVPLVACVLLENGVLWAFLSFGQNLGFPFWSPWRNPLSPLLPRPLLLGRIAFEHVVRKSKIY